jgi:3-hydroxyacyl-CoA dehydrogenase/enoyl-CoA hydratase/3-hydroxybutyryl-CoA epimerase
MGAVRLRHVDEALGRGLRQAREVFEERRRRGSLTQRDVQKRLDRLSPTLEYTGLRRADLVIEAVFEDLDLKRAILAQVEAASGEECVYASNTSSLPIQEIVKGCRRPTRVLGMHFFSPVHRMPLLEVVVTAETDAWATATAVAFGRRLGKHVIVVRDGAAAHDAHPRAVSRRGRAPVEEGDHRGVDIGPRAFGLPMGPLALIDEVGLDVAAKVSEVLHRHFGPRMAPPEGLIHVLESGRLGRKNGHGFYGYDGKRKKVDENVYPLLGVGAERRPFETREIQDRRLRVSERGGSQLQGKRPAHAARR